MVQLDLVRARYDSECPLDLGRLIVGEVNELLKIDNRRLNPGLTAIVELQTSNDALTA
ncbi:hypothetical protein COCSUDRAFT_62807 [Coccomyxa subellipsoidea C-169]|uniref:Uncharacterized protein n=1 Tax=Coccomyxa subellipsoidea (strain C-169) TaxID=574566 RepID=I0Z0Y7_COCSC|nr:hypothetical protein COCSUDRAFT_62807 [Coccomyxa subellipsoidea C-169]EIE24306.1 hypothetical protein COCSUDRAFT_62807 [Coccomyxa subellipsoidea C-169]|eukprot:XP_005648850.1 hypothetical protein COCSUDRAFT_62807 [Coccomyxa subellipsoidea C-169]